MQKSENAAPRPRRRPMADRMSRLLKPDAFLERAAEEVERAARYDRPLSVAMVLIDDLLMVRKMHGHAAGESAFLQVVERILNRTRGPDRTGRLGPTQLGILLPESTVTQATVAMERVRDGVVSTRFRIAGNERSLSLAIGVAGLSPRQRGPKTLLMSACFELRRAKSQGRNIVCAAPPDRVRMSMPRSAELH
ncbi:MAG: GGDEF domain-containing protein [Pseudomonadota bacterium]